MIVDRIVTNYDDADAFEDCEIFCVLQSRFSKLPKDMTIMG